MVRNQTIRLSGNIFSNKYEDRLLYSSINKTDRHWYNWNIVECGVKHHNITPSSLGDFMLDKVWLNIRNIISYM